MTRFHAPGAASQSVYWDGGNAAVATMSLMDLRLRPVRCVVQRHPSSPVRHVGSG